MPRDTRQPRMLNEHAGAARRSPRAIRTAGGATRRSSCSSSSRTSSVAPALRKMAQSPSSEAESARAHPRALDARRSRRDGRRAGSQPHEGCRSADSHSGRPRERDTLQRWRPFVCRRLPRARRRPGERCRHPGPAHAEPPEGRRHVRRSPRRRWPRTRRRACRSSAPPFSIRRRISTSVAAPRPTSAADLRRSQLTNRRSWRAARRSTRRRVSPAMETTGVAPRCRASRPASRGPPRSLAHLESSAIATTSRMDSSRASQVPSADSGTTKR